MDIIIRKLSLCYLFPALLLRGLLLVPPRRQDLEERKSGHDVLQGGAASLAHRLEDRRGRRRRKWIVAFVDQDVVRFLRFLRLTTH